MAKYELLPEYLVKNGIASPSDFTTPSKPCARVDVERVHTTAYVNKLLSLQLSRKEEVRTGFPLSQALIDREFIIAQGTLEGSLTSLEYGVALNIAGGTHHAYPEHGEGFCLLNDQAIAAHYLLHHGLSEKILIIDLDVHQGNGTAAIFRNEPAVFTFSMHGAANYPMHKEHSDLDIALPTGTKGKEYLSILKDKLEELIETVKPDFVFYLSGVDVLESDKLGKLSLSLDDCYRRDELVFNAFAKITPINHNTRSHGRITSKMPIQVSMGGGYTEDVDVIVKAHAGTFECARDYLNSSQ